MYNILTPFPDNLYDEGVTKVCWMSSHGLNSEGDVPTKNASQVWRNITRDELRDCCIGVLRSTGENRALWSVIFHLQEL